MPMKKLINDPSDVVDARHAALVLLGRRRQSRRDVGQPHTSTYAPTAV